MKFGHRPRTSTVVLIVAFLALWWTHEAFRPEPEPVRSDTPPAQVVPPGFMPDPNYTWVPRTGAPGPTTEPGPGSTPPAG